MLLWSTRVNLAVLGVFATLEATEIILAIGFFREAHGYSPYITHIGGWVGLATAAVAWYTSAAGVVNGMAGRAVVPVGGPLWGRVPRLARPGTRTRSSGYPSSRTRRRRRSPTASSTGA